VFNRTAKTAQRMAPMLRRVLIVDPQETSSRMLGELLREVCLPDVWTAPTNAKALRLADKVDPQLIFCVLADEGVDGTAFTRALRRSDHACRQTPVILMAAEAAPHAILAGRDAGAHEFLKRPFTAKDVLRRLEAVLLHSRGWVEAIDYVGPDRRCFNSAAYEGPHKRLADQAPPQSVRIGEALKIISSGLAAVERDPRQALRALLAQTAELEHAAAETADSQLALVNNELHRYLSEAASGGGRLDPAEASRRAQPLLNYAGRDRRAA
jgi:CheY-like chemotaxis protein